MKILMFSYLGASCPFQPLLKRSVNPSNHLPVNLPLIGKVLAPACVIFLLAFNVADVFLHQGEFVSVPLSQMPLAQVSGFLQSMFGSWAHMGYDGLTRTKLNVVGGALHSDEGMNRPYERKPL